MSIGLKKGAFGALPAVLLVCCAFGTASAQVTTGNVAGTVQDPQGGVVPGATVTLTSATRGTSLETQTKRTATSSFRTSPATPTSSQ